MARLAGKAGDVYVAIQLIENCEDVWDELTDGDAAITLDTDDYRVGSGSFKAEVGAALANGDIIATEVITPSIDLTPYSAVMFWLKHSLGTVAGDIQLLIDEDAECASPTVIDIPGVLTDVWKLCRVAQDMAGLNAIVSVGVKQTANDPGGYTLHLDDIRAAKIIAGIKSWTLDLEYDVLDSTAFDSVGVKAFLPSLSGWSGTFEGYKDGAPLTIGSVVHLDLAESATATQAFRGSAVILGLHPVGSHEGLILYSYDFRGIHGLEIPTT